MYCRAHAKVDMVTISSCPPVPGLHRVPGFEEGPNNSLGGSTCSPNPRVTRAVPLKRPKEEIDFDDENIGRHPDDKGVDDVMAPDPSTPAVPSAPSSDEPATSMAPVSVGKAATVTPDDRIR